MLDPKSDDSIWTALRPWRDPKNPRDRTHTRETTAGCAEQEDASRTLEQSSPVDVSGASLETATGASPAHAGLPPDIPGLTILEELGRGGMGVVYRVRDALDREFALKMIGRGHLSARHHERFLEEARVMARLNHPRLMRIHHFGIHEGRPYILMPIYPATLADRMDGLRAHPQAAIRLMIGVAEGVGFLHRHGFVHRDLKPKNILINELGEPVVSDFGLIKFMAAATTSGDSTESPINPSSPIGDSGLTAVGTVMGTRAYMSPEQAAGWTDRVNPRWDVWALGIILHELLTGQRPACSSDPSALLDQDAPDPLPKTRLHAGLDRRVERVIRRCLARNEADRFPDANAVVRALQPKRRLRPILMTAAAAALVLAAVAMAGRRPERPAENTPIDPAAVINAELDAGRTVTLVDESGTVQHFPTLIGSEVVSTKSWPTDQAWTIETPGTVLAEFVPPGKRPHGLRLTAQLRMNRGHEEFGFIGLYGARTETSSSLGPIQFFSSLNYSAHRFNRLAGGRQPPDGLVGHFVLNCRLMQAGDHRRPLDMRWEFQPIHSIVTPFPKIGHDEPFHEFVLEIRDSVARGWCKGVELAPAALHDAKSVFQNAPEMSVDIAPLPDLTPDGGFGIFVQRASVSIRSARVEPLD